MSKLKEIIVSQGKVLPGDILKVDSFLNHQIDCRVMESIGEEFAEIFKYIKPTKILTIETSGVAIAQATSQKMEYQPVVYAKKGFHLNMSDKLYCAKEKSYTKNQDYVIQVSKEYLCSDDKILIIDDFLANGEACNAMLEICEQAGCEVLGIGICIAKMYQPGYERIKKMNPNLHILAKVKSMSDDGKIEFEE